MSHKCKIEDPVCMMEVDIGNLSILYQGIEYSFCSQQCQERFSTNPHLYIGRPGNASPKQQGKRIIKRRTLKLENPVPDDVALKIVKALKSMMGVKEVTIDKNIVRITYDLLEATTAQIETTIEELGECLAASWGKQLKRAYIHYFEDTELDVLELQYMKPRSCH